MLLMRMGLLAMKLMTKPLRTFAHTLIQVLLQGKLKIQKMLTN